MKFFARRRARKELEMIYHELCQYLSNNYKEPAHRAREKLSRRTVELYSAGLLSEKDYLHYRNLGDEYARKMIDYHH
jgi:hypothetical protein